MNVLNIARFGLGAGCVGGAKSALQESVTYAKKRVQFGRPIAEFGLIKQKIAEMAILHRLLKPGGTICFHEYAINKSVFSRCYWRCIGHVFILPFAGAITGSTAIFRYLIESVERFLSPEEFTALLRKEGFEDVTHTPLGSWRKPILHAFLAHNPLS